MSTWEERMSAKAKARLVVTEAEAIARLEVEMPALSGESAPIMSGRQSHLGHRLHWHGSHGLMCSCGRQERSLAHLGAPSDEEDEQCVVCETRGIPARAR